MKACSVLVTARGSASRSLLLFMCRLTFPDARLFCVQVTDCRSCRNLTQPQVGSFHRDGWCCVIPWPSCKKKSDAIFLSSTPLCITCGSHEQSHVNVRRVCRNIALLHSPFREVRENVCFAPSRNGGAEASSNVTANLASSKAYLGRTEKRE
jgi:hypothetical protein